MTSGEIITNRITFDCAERDDLIESVTVFQSNRAEVRRRVDLDLKKGQNRIRIEGLPSSINENSIRVDGTGTAIIFDVVYHPPSDDYCARVSDTTDLGRTLEALQNERAIAQEQSDFLCNYGRTLDSKNVGIEDITRFLDVFGLRQLAAAKRIQELNAQIDKARERLNEVQRKEYEDAQSVQRRAAMTVTVLAEMDGAAELILTYMVLGASWMPLYDIRAFIAKTPGDASMMILHYQASITQMTGENWSDVALSLSTASAQPGVALPKLSPWHIGFLAPNAYQPVARSLATNSETLSDPDPIDPKTQIEAYIPSRLRMGVRRAYVKNTGVLNATFGIPGRSSIPTDEGSHKVLITVLDLPVDLEWGKIVNSSEFTLLPGEISVFMDHNFVFKSRMEHISPNESFKALLGVDPALRVAYPTAKAQNLTTTHSGLSFMSKEQQSVSYHSQKILIRNSRLTSICIRILDHVPVSIDTQLGVSIISPRELGATPIQFGVSIDGGIREEDKWKDVRRGVKVRWASSEDGVEGIVEWNCNIAPSDEAEMELTWEISGPAGKRWQDL
ncbi:Protein F37C4,5 [Rhizoctonia solani AG-1 IB]|nr:Protein F37C4,5 [Rhizoctonia solani AG-1 IB]